MDAEEHYSVQPPGFVWVGTARLGPFAVPRARDMHADSKGQMLVKVASLWPVVDAGGEQMDQAAMMRYLSEMIWFPAAFLAGSISGETVDDCSAALGARPVWLFSSGPVGEPPKPAGNHIDVTKILQATKAATTGSSPASWSKSTSASPTGPLPQPSAPPRATSATGPSGQARTTAPVGCCSSA